MFSLDGTSAAQVALATITIMALVIPNFTVTIPGPFYSPSQLAFVTVVSVVVYGTFIFTQTVAHRPFFLEGEPTEEPALPSGPLAVASATLLLLCLIVVVALAPEGLAALRAARHNRLQTSLNLALGSALASTGLTMPAIGLLSLAMGSKLILGIDTKSTVLLTLSLFAMTLVLRTGGTIILHGVVLLVIFAVYLFLTVVP